VLRPSFVLIRRARPRSILFPYTTLFRSGEGERERGREGESGGAGEPVPAGFVSALYEETEGNPFYVEEVLKHLLEEGAIYREGIDRKSTRLNCSHEWSSYAVFCLKKRHG